MKMYKYSPVNKYLDIYKVIVNHNVLELKVQTFRAFKTNLGKQCRN